MPKENLKLVAGTASRQLAEEVSRILKVPLMPVDIRRFSDGETYCRILESVRGADVYIIQSTSPDVDHNLMELLIMSDALKRSSPFNITAITPYYGYCRQDKKAKSREPITAKLVANMITGAGVHRIVTFDLHVAQVQGFFDIPSDNMEVMPLFAEYIVNLKKKDMVVVSPDAGGTARARALATELNSPIAIVDKRRPAPNVAEVLNVIGNVKGKTAIIIDDIIDTAGTVIAASEILLEFGAAEVYVVATHALLSGAASERLEKSRIKEVLASNTIELPEEKKFSKLKVISVASVLAETIKRTHEGLPMGVFYEDMHRKIQEKVSK